jgi:predicted acetyltransferase
MHEPNIDPVAITVLPADPTDVPLIQNLVQLYTHDFSEFWAGTPRGDVNAVGRFADYPLDPYWSKEGWSAVLIRCNARVAGFALINNETHSGMPAESNMGEFFILRKYRGRGVGRMAAELIFSQHPGTWEAAVARKNVRAWNFWRKTVSASEKASSIQQFDVNSSTWNGPILRFQWGTT